MSHNSEELQRLIAEMAVLIENNDDPDPQLYALFFQHPEFAFPIVELIHNFDEAVLQEGPPVFSACIFALDICVAQLQAATEANNKSIAKSLVQLMSRIADLIRTNKHTLSYWLPVLNSFYEVHVELTQELKDAYFDLASQEDDDIDEDDQMTHLESIRDLIHELSDLSIFNITENFFAQSYAMPPEFFTDLIVDLYSIAEGQDIALLTLLHPKAEVRSVAISTLDQLMDKVTLSSISLTRLQIIKHWYAESYHSTFERWIRMQRKQGVVFAPEPELAQMKIRATEVDGSGSQGIFIHVGKNRKNRLCGLLLKYELGIKDAWATPVIPAAEVADYYRQAFEESVTLREVDLDYFKMIVAHFLAVTIERGEIAHLHFLEILELLGLRIRPEKMDIEYVLGQLSVQITPFTQEVIFDSLQRSKNWLKNKSFTESWFLENPTIDKIVNHNSNFVDGIKVCRLADAMNDVFEKEMELNREQWTFHFLWIALWLKAKERKNEKSWTDSFLIAYSIHEGQALKDIPLMQAICNKTVLNSVDTMQERRTHLNPE
ncbi:MAG: hypothetical protein Q8M40_12585 [Legionella sp.]|nr:hypothetical protein [Legionella sp.]